MSMVHVAYIVGLGVSWCLFAITIIVVMRKKRQQDNIYHRAHHDYVTGLANRHKLAESVEIEIKRCDRNRTKLALLFIDIDHFKKINDEYNHKVGDEILKAFATRLKEAVRETDFVARYGGDEFIALLTGIENENAVLSVVKEIFKEVCRPYEINDTEFNLTCSIGVSLYRGRRGIIDELVEHADVAMYTVKDQGRNNYKMFRPKKMKH